MRILSRLFSMTFAGIYMMLFAIAIGAATFIENDFGTPTAKKMVYNATWFEVLLLFFAIALIVNIFKFKLYRKVKLPLFTFHLAMLIILLGSAITRFISYEGVMHIREGDSSDMMLSEKTFISLKAVTDNDAFFVNEKVLFGSMTKNRFRKKYKFGDKNVAVELLDFIPNAVQRIEEEAGGEPIISFAIAGSMGREDVNMRKGEEKNILDKKFIFSADANDDFIRLFDKNDSVFFISPFPVSIMNMTTNKTDTVKSDTLVPLLKGNLYKWGNVSMVLKNYYKSGKFKTYSTSKRMESGKMNLAKFKVTSDGKDKIVELFGNSGEIGTPKNIHFDGLNLSLSYGAQYLKLPFTIKLNDFQLERYPGSNSPSSYASEVTLIDDEQGINKPYRIFMNHVLEHRGYRFFQSSYDQDEGGTILSVNHDSLGTLLTYFGYLLLTLGMFWALFTGKTRFKKMSKTVSQLKEQRKEIVSVLIFLFAFSFANAQYSLPDTFKIINPAHAAAFGRVQIQDKQGRMKPVNTLSSQIIRKLAKKVVGKEEIFGQNPDQVLLGMIIFPFQWQNVPMIRVSDKKLQNILGIKGKYATFNDFFDKQKGGYILSKFVKEAHLKKGALKGRFDHDVLKVDERINICYLIYYQELLQIFPRENDKQQKWYSPIEAQKQDFGDANIFVQKFMQLYAGSIKEAVKTGNWKKADENLGYLKEYQKQTGSNLLLSENKISFEILYNKLRIFQKLSLKYWLIGSILLALLVINIFLPKFKFKYAVIGAIVIIALGFLVHTAGLGIRWYIAGRAPWSNGYEAMIYIGWAILLAGLIFAKRSLITLAVTSILTALTLFVAGLSWMDPEITNLVPVLKSYWLTIHVSIITASYGFLALGALIGFLNLVLMIFRTKKTAKNVTLTIEELTAINEMVLIIGLYALSIGTFLGGIWANESWGRYWGWDAKETWSLVSILVYSFIVHMRLIPGLKGVFTFNFASLIGLSTIIMTFFGVNFYLTGLHSYAAGDPVPVPTFVYVTLMVITIVSVLAYFRNDAFQLAKKKRSKKVK